MTTHAEDYKAFRKMIAQKKAVVEHTEGGLRLVQKTWSYFDSGAKDGPAAVPLICLPGLGGRAEYFYRQLSCLAPRGVRVIAASPPAYFDVESFAEGLECFMQRIGVSRAHFFGVELGGFLAQFYARLRPARVVSLALCNSFCSTSHFEGYSSAVSKMFEWTPEFMLKRYALSRLPQLDLPPTIAESFDFYVEQVEASSQSELAAQLTIMHTPAETISPRPLTDDRVLIMHTIDGCTLVPTKATEELSKVYYSAKEALIKTGGPFPFVSNHEEVNMLLQVHVRTQNQALDEREGRAPKPEPATPQS